jgi:hypothetical protein
VIIFATSDKGGTGRSVTSSNILYRTALAGLDVCYADFDFGSPTSGAIFGAESLARGTESKKGIHQYLKGEARDPQTCDLWSVSDRGSLRNRPAGAGRMVLLPGDAGGGEFQVDSAMRGRCLELFERLEEEFALSIVDLSAGRSYATQMALAVTADKRFAAATSRWLVFHRWTQQHVVAANSLVYGERGLLDVGGRLGHDQDELLDRIRFVRTAIIDPNSPDLAGLRPSQLAWLSERNHDLQLLAGELRLGRGMLLGSVPLDPVLQWHEQLLTDDDLFARQVANPVTVEAMENLAARIRDDAAWERL